MKGSRGDNNIAKMHVSRFTKMCHGAQRKSKNSVSRFYKFLLKHVYKYTQLT